LLGVPHLCGFCKGGDFDFDFCAARPTNRQTHLRPEKLGEDGAPTDR
jgi:hypothetical protein